MLEKYIRTSLLFCNFCYSVLLLEHSLRYISTFLVAFMYSWSRLSGEQLLMDLMGLRNTMVFQQSQFSVTLFIAQCILALCYELSSLSGTNISLADGQVGYQGPLQDDFPSIAGKRRERRLQFKSALCRSLVDPPLCPFRYPYNILLVHGWVGIATKGGTIFHPQGAGERFLRLAVYFQRFGRTSYVVCALKTQIL